MRPDLTEADRHKLATPEARERLRQDLVKAHNTVETGEILTRKISDLPTDSRVRPDPAHPLSTLEAAAALLTQAGFVVRPGPYRGLQVGETAVGPAGLEIYERPFSLFEENGLWVVDGCGPDGFFFRSEHADPVEAAREAIKRWGRRLPD